MPRGVYKRTPKPRALKSSERMHWVPNWEVITYDTGDNGELVLDIVNRKHSDEMFRQTLESSLQQNGSVLDRLITA